MPNYSRTNLKTNVTSMLSGTVSDTNLSTIINRAVREVISDLDLRSTKRKSALSPNIFDDIFQYTCPTDMKEKKIVDIKPQIDRGRFDDWRLTTEEEFDRFKEDNRIDEYGDPIKVRRSQWLGDSIVAISDDDMVRKLLISRPLDNDSVTIDPLDAVGSWIGFGDGENLTKDSDDYVKGSASINWDISSAGGTTAGIVNSALTTFDVSEYKTTGSIFVWAYISSTTNLTNFIIRIGSGSGAYYQITVTTNNEGNAFEVGWNLLRFDFVNKSTTGTPDDDGCVYVALYMTKAAGKISETDYRFDDLTMAKGDHYDLIFYSKYGWVSNASVRLENSTADTDLLLADTEEIRLIEYKTAELAERHLKNYDASNDYLQKYLGYANKYKLENPSEALILTSNYYVI